ncbi:Phosphate-import permease protein PhnE [Planctomycetaceae bacterium]|nr:Phosphate-import permease protein PhnE [Planctomycetaceae bacterium]
MNGEAQNNALKRYQRRPLWNFFALFGVLLAVYLAFFAVDPTNANIFAYNAEVWDFSSFTDAEKFGKAMTRVRSFVGSFANPNTEPEVIDRAWELTWQTLSAALLGTALAVVFGYLLALGASKAVCVGEERPTKLWWLALRKPSAFVCMLCRLILDVLRAIPDFAWAVLLVPLLGIGPMTGMIALAISVTGILGKIYSELWDSVDPRRYENVRAVGAGRMRTFMYGIRPLASRGMLSYTLMRAECAIRNAAVIGAVGGGGVGAEIKLRLDYGEYDRVATMVIFTIAMTIAADLAANFIRRQLRIDPNHPRAASNQTLGAQLTRKWVGAGFAFTLVIWSAWYQLQPHPLTVNEPQLPKLMALFEPKGWQNMAFFKELLQPDFSWEVERTGGTVQTMFVGPGKEWNRQEQDPKKFIEMVRGKRLCIGPPGSEPSHDGPRSYIEKLTGEPLEKTFSQVIVSKSDADTIIKVGKGEVEVGAIEWKSFRLSLFEWEETKPYRKKFRSPVDQAHTTDFYYATRIEPGEVRVALKTASIPVAMAIVGTLIGVLGAMLLAFLYSFAFQIEPQQFTGETPSLAARVSRWACVVFARAVALLSRGMPEVMWAMFFVAFFGMGVVAGAAAIAIHTLGLMARVFSETVDNIPYRRFEQAFGGSRFATFSYAAVPMSWRDWMTYSLFQFESNVRAGIVLGIIGSVGLGFEFARKFEHFHYREASVDLIAMILLTIIIDRGSRALKLNRVTA